MTRTFDTAETNGRDSSWGDLRAPASEAVARTVAAGVERYQRDRHLPRLIPLTPKEIADTRPEARRAILTRLARALRAERNRGRAGHWTYDLNRHIGLRQAYAAERMLLGERTPVRETKPPPRGRRR